MLRSARRRRQPRLPHKALGRGRSRLALSVVRHSTGHPESRDAPGSARRRAEPGAESQQKTARWNGGRFVVINVPTLSRNVTPTSFASSCVSDGASADMFSVSCQFPPFVPRNCAVGTQPATLWLKRTSQRAAKLRSTLATPLPRSKLAQSAATAANSLVADVPATPCTPVVPLAPVAPLAPAAPLAP